MNMSPLVDKIKNSANSRVVPMPGESIDGKYQIEVYTNNKWETIISGLGKSIAEDIVRQASNKVILG